VWYRGRRDILSTIIIITWVSLIPSFSVPPAELFRVLLAAVVRNVDVVAVPGEKFAFNYLRQKEEEEVASAGRKGRKRGHLEMADNRHLAKGYLRRLIRQTGGGSRSTRPWPTQWPSSSRPSETSHIIVHVHRGRRRRGAWGERPLKECVCLASSPLAPHTRVVVAPTASYPTSNLSESRARQ